MKVAVIGGAGVRTPLLVGGLTDSDLPIEQIALYDVDQPRLKAIGAVAARMASKGRVTLCESVAECVAWADVVFTSIRVGGIEQRIHDEAAAQRHGIVGQETVGPAGFAMAMRTIPAMVRYTRQIAEAAPRAWIVNFTNPVGMVTEAMRTVSDRVIGICDTPTELFEEVARVLELDSASCYFDYFGLNHLGWLRGLRHEGVDVLPRLLGDDALLGATEEGQLFGLDWLRTLGSVPNEYLYYYYFAREAVAAIRSGGPTRGEFLREQQGRFYDAVAAEPGRARELWVATRREREETYMTAEHAGRPRGGEEGVADVGGYEGVALALMRAIARDEPASMILNVRNGSTVAGLPEDAVVEVPVTVDASGPVASAVSPPDLHQRGLMEQVKAVDRLTIEAATTGSVTAAEKAFGLHPLVDSAAVARQLVAAYRQRIPEVDAVLGGSSAVTGAAPSRRP